MKAVIKRWQAVLLCLLLPVFVAGCGSSDKPYREMQFAMDTMIEITATGSKAEQAVESAFAQMHRLSALFDAHSPDSEISRINGNAGGAAILVSEDTFCLLEQAVDFARTTDGAFDPTIGPMVELWGISRKQDYVPISYVSSWAG